MSNDKWQRLQEFRESVYQNLGRARDATFELMDAVMLSRKVDSLADLSLCPSFRRKWHSSYEALEDTRPNANKLMRLYLGQIPTEWGAPPAYGGRGRPRVHGEKFKLNDPTTWATPAQVVEVDDPKLGRVRVQMWHQLHFRSSPKHPMTLFRVERLEHPNRQPLWLVWVGQPTARPSIDVWHYYLRRFCVDHWYRFAKQRLHWTMPKLKTPQQAERWSCLMPAITWQLWLARDGVGDRPLPWQKPVGRLTPGRTAQAIGSVLARLGTPTCLPKPRGKSPGWPKGRERHSFPTYPLVKKGLGRFRKPKGFS